MIKYINYLFVVISRKMSTYLIPIFAILVSAAMVIPSIRESNLKSTPESAINSLSTFIYFLPFIFGAMFVATKALNIFKDGEEDGTELLITSKQISRFSIIFGKFITLYILIIAYNILMFFALLGIGLIDKQASLAEVFKFSSSWAMGGMLIMLLFSSIIILIASSLSKVGTLTMGIVIPAIIPIASFTVTPLGDGYIPRNGVAIKTQLIYKDGKDGNKYIASKDYFSLSNDKKTAKDFLKKQENGWYKYIAPVDIWQHLNSFYHVFQKKENLPGQMGIQWKLKKETMKLEGLLSIKMTNKFDENHTFAIDNKRNIQEPISNVPFEKLYASLKEAITNKKEKFNNDITSQNLDEQARQIITFMNDSPKFKELYEEGKKFNSNILVSIVQKIMNEDAGVKFKSINEKDSQNGILYAGLIKADNFETIVGKPYVPKSSSMPIYILVLFILSGFTIIRFMRRDFK